MFGATANHRKLSTSLSTSTFYTLFDMAHLCVEVLDEALMTDGLTAAYTRILTRELWPETMPYYAGHPLRFPDVEANALVPIGQESLYDWARVLDNPNPMDRARNKALLLINPSRPGIMERVAIKVQGFVAPKGLSLETMGNWKGGIENAMGARQTLSLCGGPYPEAFQKQQRALQALVKHTALHVGYTTSFKVSHTRLDLERPVFTRARGNKKPALTLSNADDPMHKAESIRQHWIVTERLPIGRRLEESNQIVAASPFAIRAGDFVEATITLDISVRGTTTRKGYIRFWVSRVARLCRKEQVPRNNSMAPTLTVIPVVPEFATMGDDVEWPEEDE
ncbi:hypothetical protein QCA50_015089 [Cerrena zonata]|uniref:Uncharacterized protein n=1 Tax=Cerrena zonata TaxID=2478898 RepID=A0AAW0FNM9_9APHY